MHTNQITAREARELFNYDPLTGTLTWRSSIARNVPVGTIAGGRHSKGYVKVKIYGRMYFAHRLAWLISYGRFPKNQIDHINRNRADNRLANLRDVTQSENMANAVRPTRYRRAAR